MKFIIFLFAITLASRTFAAPAKDGAIVSADSNLDVDEKQLEKSVDVKSEKADVKASEASVKAEDKDVLSMTDIKKEEMKDLEAKEKGLNNDNTLANDLKKEDKTEIKKLNAKDKVINAEDTSAIIKKDIKKEDSTKVKAVDSKKETEKVEDEIEKDVLKKVENSESKPLEAKEKAVDMSENEKKVPNPNEEIKPPQDLKIDVPSFDVKISDFDPKLLEAVPEIRTLYEVKMQLQESVDKLKKISPKDKPTVLQSDDGGKAAEVSVSTSSDSSSKPFSIIKNFATAAGNFISSLIQLPITFLTSIQQIIVDIGISKPNQSSPQFGFSALLGAGTTPPPQAR